VRRGLLLLRDKPRVVRLYRDAGAYIMSTLAHRGLIRFPFIY
jgi:predicted MPP superfamily phosphohydrolase